MHPAPSVILFTTASGLGFGMMALLGLGFGPTGTVSGPLTAFIAFVLAGGGLAASTFHLGNPQRALLAFTQWRSSWLSREGCVSVALMLLFGLFAFDWAISGEPMRLLGLICTVLAVLAVFCTAMIYGQLKTVPRWSNPFTPAMFFGAALSSGMIALGFADALAGETPPLISGFLVIIGSAAVYAYRRSVMKITLAEAGHSPESATGLGALGQVRLLEGPHSQPNYLMKEMVFQVGRKHAEKLAVLSVIFGLFAPLFLYIICRDAEAFSLSPSVGAFGLGLALLLNLGGALASRWLFFAEAQHVVGLYYGKR